MVVDQLTDDEVDRLFQALADATRRDILARTIQHEQSVSTLAARYDSGVSFLEVLGLSGGMPTLVSVPKTRLHDALRFDPPKKREIRVAKCRASAMRSR